MSWKHVFTAQKASCILCCKSVVSRSMDVLLCSHETTQEVLLLVLVSLAQERHGHVSVGTKERHKNDQKAETPLLWRSLTELGLLSLEKRGLQRDLIAAFQYIKWTEEKDGERLFSGACREKSRVNSFKLKEKVRKKDLDWIKGRLFIYLLFFFMLRVVRPWNNLPREAVDALDTLEGFKVGFVRALSNLVSLKMSLPMAEGVE